MFSHGQGYFGVFKMRCARSRGVKEGYNSGRQGGSGCDMRREHKFVNVLGRGNSLLGYGRGKDSQLTPQLRRPLLLHKARHKSLSVKLWSASSGVHMCNVNYATEYSSTVDTRRSKAAPRVVKEPLPGADQRVLFSQCHIGNTLLHTALSAPAPC